MHDFYNTRRAGLRTVGPNAAHGRAGEAGTDFSGDFLLVTQNIDDLHERAGSRKLVHMHGELLSALCPNCGLRHPWPGDMRPETPCPACHSTGYLRPDVVWFGEMPYHMDRIGAALARADLFVSIGTSGNVYPAAQFVRDAGRAGAHTVELNLEPSDGIDDFDVAIHGRATEIVPPSSTGCSPAPSDQRRFAGFSRSATASTCGDQRNWSIGVTDTIR